MEFPCKVKIPPRLQAYVEAWGKEDADALAACFDEPCEFLSPLVAAPLRSRAEIRAYFADLFQRVPGIQTHGSRFFMLGSSTLTVTELTVRNPSWGEGLYLMTSAQLQRFSEAGLITHMEVFLDVEAAVKV
ncbi:MAG TPA: nuclear transport factor 2 family protein [Geothrix sp.]|nr:nuclear transport factor 2 family protein [Geothrix sp.]